MGSREVVLNFRDLFCSNCDLVDVCDDVVCSYCSIYKCYSNSILVNNSLFIYSVDNVSLLDYNFFTEKCAQQESV